MRNLSKVKKILSWTLKILIVVLAYGFLYNQVVHGRDLQKIYADIIGLTDLSDFFVYFWLVVFMMFVNWSIETRKWQLLISKLETVSFLTAFQAVLAGMTISSFTPNRIGEFIGRIFILDKANKWEGVFVTIIGSLSQLLTTLIVGMIAVFFFIPYYFGNSEVNIYLYVGIGLVAITAIVLLMLAYFNLEILVVIARRLGFARSNPLIRYLRVFALFSNKALAKILWLSFLRYTVFTTQFYLLLHVLNVDISYPAACMLIALIFFIDTAIPTIVLTEWGVRASLAVFMFTTYFNYTGMVVSEATTIAIVAASTLLWFINLVIPAIIGSVFIFKLKFENQ